MQASAACGTCRQQAEAAADAAVNRQHLQARHQQRLEQRVAALDLQLRSATAAKMPAAAPAANPESDKVAYHAKRVQAMPLRQGSCTPPANPRVDTPTTPEDEQTGSVHESGERGASLAGPALHGPDSRQHGCNAAVPVACSVTGESKYCPGSPGAQGQPALFSAEAAEMLTGRTPSEQSQAPQLSVASSSSSSLVHVHAATAPVWLLPRYQALAILDLLALAANTAKQHQRAQHGLKQHAEDTTNTWPQSLGEEDAVVHPGTSRFSAAQPHLGHGSIVGRPRSLESAAQSSLPPASAALRCETSNTSQWRPASAQTRRARPQSSIVPTSTKRCDLDGLSLRPLSAVQLSRTQNVRHSGTAAAQRQPPSTPLSQRLECAILGPRNRLQATFGGPSTDTVGPVNSDQDDYGTCSKHMCQLVQITQLVVKALTATTGSTQQHGAQSVQHGVLLALRECAAHDEHALERWGQLQVMVKEAAPDNASIAEFSQDLGML